MRRMLLSGCIAAVAFAGLTVTAAAQDVGQPRADRGPRFLYAAPGGSQPTAIDVASVPSLRRRITLSLNGVERRQALDEIARAGGFQLVYANGVVPNAGHVRLKAEDITVAAALTEALFDAGVDVVLSSGGNMVLVKRTAPKLPLIGTIQGQVIENGTTSPVMAAEVLVAGTKLTRRTDDKGRYVVTGVPAGDRQVTVRRLGFEAASRSVHLNDGETVTRDFLLTRTATKLTEMVTTATGERSRLEVGNSIGTIKVDSVVPSTLIRNFSDLLTARTPGVVVTNTTGIVGAPSKIRIRGVNSMMLNNDPIIIIDGVRIQSQVTNNSNLISVGTSQEQTGSASILPNVGLNGLIAGGAVTGNRTFASSRLDDLDPNSIESIDVLKGPSATSLYGTEASNGVIVVKTKRGKAGDYRWNVLADQGWSYNPGKLPAMYIPLGHLADGTWASFCGLTNNGGSNVGPTISDGSCTIDSVVAIQPQNNPDITTLGTGSARNLSATVSGGSEKLTQFFSARLSDNLGIPKLSDAETRRLTRMWGTEPPSWMKHPNTEQDINLNMRTGIIPSSKVDITLSAGGSYRNILGGGTGLQPVSGGFASLQSTGLNDTLLYLPGETMRTRQSQGIQHGTLSGAMNYTPLSWVTLRGTVGTDYAQRNDELQNFAQYCTTQITTSCVGGRSTGEDQTLVATVDVGATFSFTPRPWMTSRTAVGEQYNDTRFYHLFAGNASGTQLAFGSTLLAPTPVVVSGTQQYSVAEDRDENATAGRYIEQTVGLRERVFLTAGFRQDVASSFGKTVNAKAPVYPKYSVSWLVSDESFFPLRSVISSFRLRSAYGHSGKVGAQNLVVNGFRQGTSYINDGTATGTTIAPGVTLSSIGNPDLKPERTAELEGGFEAALFGNDRFTIDATMYRKLSQDAIIGARLPDSFGASSGGGLAINIGEVENRGTELSMTARLIDRRSIGWSVSVNATANSNRLVRAATPVSIVQSTGSLGPVQYKVGYPLFSYFANRVLSYKDRNGDGVLSYDEVVFTDTAVFMGNPFPRQENTYRSDLSLLNGTLRFSTSVDQVLGLAVRTTGNAYFNRCNIDPSCSLARQAYTMQAQVNGATVPANTLRIQELAVTYNLTRHMAGQLLHAQSAAITFAGRNLGLWTTYAGKDPNLDATTNGFTDAPSDGGSTLAQPRNWTLRLNLGF